jgi:hypothetical protein
MDEYNKVLTQARELSEKERPEASAYKHAAFANSVAYAVTGWSGGYGGPSVREHAAARVTRPEMTVEDACEELLKKEGVIFGPIIDLHRAMFRDEHCFDDDPEDLEILNS